MLWCALTWTVTLLTRTVLLLFLLWLAKELTMGICLNKKRLDGKVVLVTGGTAGIGYETALDLAGRGATVVITGRDEKKGAAAAATIRRASRCCDQGADVQFRSLDLSSQKDVRRFAKEIGKQFPRIHYLINNAGTVGDAGAYGKGKYTEDGFELIMATNFLGHVTLTEMLLENLKEAGKEKETDESFRARIVNVSSFGHNFSDLDPSNQSHLEMKNKRKDFSNNTQYRNSKLAQILYSNELSRQLKTSCFNIESVSVHPGAVRTEIFRDTSDKKFKTFVSVFFWLLGKNSWQGAQTTIYAVVAEERLGGKYLADCREERLLVSRKVGKVGEERKLYEEVRKVLGLK